MPTLGDTNSTNQIYLNHIRNVLDEDRRINRQVFNLEKQNVSKYNEVVVPQNAVLSKATTDNMDSLVAAFNKKAEEINNTIKIIYSQIMQKYMVSPEKYKDIMEVFDIVNYYNNIVSLVKSPTLSQTEKLMTESKAMQILPLIESVRLNYKRLIIAIFNGIDEKDPEISLVERILPQIISVYSLFNLMDSNLNSKNFSVITFNDIQNAYSKTIINDFPMIRNIDSVVSQLKESNEPLIKQQYQIFEEEYGRKPNTKEKQLINNKFANKYEPIFSGRTVNSLENYSNLKKSLLSDTQLKKVEKQANKIVDEGLAGFDEIKNKETEEKEDIKLKDMKDFIKLFKGKRQSATIKKKIKEYEAEIKKIEDSRRVLEAVPEEDLGEYATAAAPVEDELEIAEGYGKKTKKRKTILKTKPVITYDDAENESYAY